MKNIFVLLTALCLLSISQAQAQTCTTDNGLVGHWLFNGNYSDLTSNANTGTQSGGVTFTTGLDGVANGALQFDGTNDVVNMPDIAAYHFGTTDFTLSHWFSSSSPTVTMFMATKSFGASFPYPGIVSVLDNSPSQGNTYARTSANAGILDNGVRNNGQWHHLVFTRTGSLLSLYIDGVLSGSGTFPIDDVTNTATLTLGKNLGFSPYWYNGKLDNLRLYNRSLSGAEVTSLFNNETNGVTSCPLSNNIPTLSQWGLIIFGLLLLCTGAVAVWNARYGRASKGVTSLL